MIIEIAFAGDDFSFNIVAQHSSIETPSGYKLAAMWSSQEGSLLLWAFVLSIAASAALYATRNRLRELVPWATAVMMGVAAFFTGLMLFAPDVDPFATLSPAPADGVGLNPLLQHPSMMIHPPMLYSGYVAFTVPFAFAIGALVTRRLDAEWIRATRRFALIAWAFLGFGLLLGARWSYTELGWGGYWAWDPVENAALMPWLLGTAFLHSIMVQEKRGMLKVWNATLIVGTFSMALLGTFLVRSGVLQSIHAFGDNTVGPYILGLIGVVLVGSTALIVSRLDDLRSPKRIDSLASRESVFLVNNLLLVGMTAVIFWGTFFPLISELFTGEKASLAAPWFDRYTTPLAIGLVLFTGIGPLLAWRRVSWESAKRVFRAPIAVAAVVTLGLVLFTDAADSLWALALFAFAAFAMTGLAQEFWTGAAARKRLSGEPGPQALVGLVSRNRRRYGGYIVHVGIIVLLIGVAGSSSFQTNRDVELRPGESTTVDGRTITYVKPTVSVDEEKLGFGALLRIEEDGKVVGYVRPSRQFFRPTGQETGEDRHLLRGRGDQRGRPPDRARPRPLDRRAAERRRCAARCTAGRQRLQRLRPGGARDPAAVQSAGGTDARRRRQSDPARPGLRTDLETAGPGCRKRGENLPHLQRPLDLQGDRQPARHLDVDRRHHRPGRRPDRALALARPRAAAPSSAPKPTPARKRSTGRSATPSLTTPSASSPTRTSPSSTPSCGARRWRSSMGARTGRATATVRTPVSRKESIRPRSPRLSSPCSRSSASSR